jgi:penicillin-binding protein 1C
LFKSSYSTLLYGSEGRLLGARIAADGQWRFPPSDRLPSKIASSLIAYEDKRFHLHPGFDPAAILGAIRINLLSGRTLRGGSTITMQIARIARGNRPRNLSQKLIETLWAIYLESRYGKSELLSLYASHAPFGGNVIGAETAAWRYFGREAAELSWAESATLAVLPNSPSLIHPGRNRSRLMAKRNRLLSALRRKSLLSHTEYELACMEPLPDAPLPLPDEAPHLLERMAAGGLKGHRIMSSIQPHLQQQTQEIVNRYAGEYAANHVYNIAAIIADVETGRTLAYIGNTSDANGSTLSRAVNVDLITAGRSTGSILKPFLYAAMLHEGMILPASLVADVPLNINGFSPQNFSKSFQGAVPAHRAIEQSLNVPLVRMLVSYNIGRFISLLKRWGMTTLRFSEDHYGASLILGGAEGSLWDMVGMYASMARTLSHYHTYNGRYHPADIRPLTLLAASQPADPILSISDPRLRDESPIVSAIAAWYALRAMSALNRPEEEAEWQQFSSMKQIAWKTGTSYGNRDAWAIGITPRFAAGVWVGNASGEGRPGLTGVGYAAPILFDIFSLLPGGKWFDFPFDEAVEVAVCRQSGHQASALCPAVDTLYLPASGKLSAVCPFHRTVHLSADLRYRVNASCEPADRIVSRPWFVLPPAQAFYYRNYHADYMPLPPYRPDCEPDAGAAIEIIYPEPDASLYLPKGFGGEYERFVFRAAHARPDATIYWHADDEFLGETHGAYHQLSCRLSAGRHVLTLVDDRGRRVVMGFSVRAAR